MFTLSEDILEMIEKQYKYDLVCNEDIAEDEKKKYDISSDLACNAFERSDMAYKDKRAGFGF